MRCRYLFVLGVLFVAGRAHAFVDPASFFVQTAVPHASTLGASTEGIYFTGSPRFANLTCRSCHIDSPGKVGIRLGADDPSIFDLGYQPGKTYSLQIELVDEQMGLDHGGATCTEPGGPRDTGAYVQCNNNAFVLEIDQGDTALASGFCQTTPVGGRCPTPDPSRDQTMISPDGTAVFANRAHDANTPRIVTRNGATQWTFAWTAPAAGTGPLTLHVAAVDGNGGDGTITMDQDPLNDDVVEAAVPLNEAGGTPTTPVSAGCAQAGASPSPSPLGLALVALAVLALRRLLGERVSGSRERATRPRGR